MNFDVKFNITNENFDVDFNITSENFAVDFGEITEVMPEPYGGEYIVIPKLDEETILPTKNKAMGDDVTVREIPWEEVENLKGGLTVTIGGY